MQSSQRTHSQLVLLDLDRTIFDSDRFYVDICKLLAAAKLVEPALLEQARALVKHPDRHLYMTDIINRQGLTSRMVFKLIRQKLKPNAYLFKDVESFIRRLRSARVIIITTGTKQYQGIKLELSPLLEPYQQVVIEQLDNGAYIASKLRERNHQLSLSGLTAHQWFDELIFVDDRDYNFTSLARIKNAKLYHIQRLKPRAKLPGLAGVKQIKSLEEIT